MHELINLWLMMHDAWCLSLHKMPVTRQNKKKKTVTPLSEAPKFDLEFKISSIKS